MPSALTPSTDSLYPQPSLIEGAETKREQLVEELCDQLLDHTFDCDNCIDGHEESCPVFCSLRQRINAAGGPTKTALLAF